MSPKSKPPLTAGKMHDASFCHYCNVNKLDPKDKYYLPNEIEVCKECAEKRGSEPPNERPGANANKFLRLGFKYGVR